MVDGGYQLRYLPLFYQDMSNKVSYICDVLKNPQAANDLINAVERAILERCPVAESFEPYRSAKKRKELYYRIYVKNYVVYYVVLTEGDRKVMEVRRLLYNKQNVRKLI